MSDNADVYYALRENQRSTKAMRRSVNLDILSNSGRKFEVSTYMALFREPGKPIVDFYLTTNKWVSGGVTYRGDALAFLRWYSRQRVN